jgi:hypothetical protein
VDRQRIGQCLSVQVTHQVFHFDGCLQDERHVVEQGIAGLKVRHYLDATCLEPVGGTMDEQHGVHIKGDELGLPFPGYSHEFAGHTRDRVACGGEEESLIEGNSQACRLACPIDGVRWRWVKAQIT